MLVEYGASDETKAEFLLRACVVRAYVPIDVAQTQLAQMQTRLERQRPDLQVCVLAADFMDVVALPTLLPALLRLGFFPGSTIGNLDPQQARGFLQRARQTLGQDSWFLAGVDLRKDPAILLPAYDDAQGVTAAFNRNLLTRLNREAGADFNLDTFAHRAEWNDAESRIEMHLVSLKDQTVRVGGQALHFLRGETIHTENSYKYAPERFAALAQESGWHCAEMWTDPRKLFSLHLLEPLTGPA